MVADKANKGMEMKRPLKSIMAVLLVSLVLGAGVLAYTALTATVTIEVEEPLSFVGANTFSVTMYPQGTATRTITIANASPIALEIDLVETIVPPLRGITVTYPKKIVIPAAGQGAVIVSIAASKSAEPGSYVITIQVTR